MLAITYAVERFNDYTFGRKTTVYTDHKPLMSIVKKPLHVVPCRLQRIPIRLQKYDLDIVYQPGTQMYIADALSRAHLSDADGEQDDLDTVHAVQQLAVSGERLQQLRHSTEEDEVCKSLQRTIIEGWPEDKRCLPTELVPFFFFS